MGKGLIDAGFDKLGIPMLKKFAEGSCPALEKYEKCLAAKTVFTMAFDMAKMDEGVLQTIDDGVVVRMEREAIFPKAVTKRSIVTLVGRKFAVRVLKIADGIVYVSHVDALYGDGTLKAKTEGYIRVLIGKIATGLEPYREELRKQAEKEVRQGNDKGADMSEQKFQTRVYARYSELANKKKDELDLKRCFVKATVMEVSQKKVIINIFDLDIYGVVNRNNWSAGARNLDLTSIVKIGETVDVEVLYATNVDGEGEILRAAWECSRRNVTEKEESRAFEEACRYYGVKDIIPVVANQLHYGVALPYWTGTIKGTDIGIRCKCRKGINIEKGKTYLVRIYSIDKEKCAFFGETHGIYNPGAHIAGIETRGRSGQTKMKKAKPATGSGEE